MSEAKPPDLAYFRELDKRAAFPQLVGATLETCADGYAEVALPWRDDLGQHHGYLHGALVGFLADYACAWAAGSVGGDVVTAQYTLNFLAPGVGDRFVGRGRVVKASKRQIVCRADVFAVRGGEEKLIAIANATIVPLNGGDAQD